VYFGHFDAGQFSKSYLMILGLKQALGDIRKSIIQGPTKLYMFNEVWPIYSNTHVVKTGRQERRLDRMVGPKFSLNENWNEVIDLEDFQKD
jgi:hypothetical protein